MLLLTKKEKYYCSPKAMQQWTFSLCNQFEGFVLGVWKRNWSGKQRLKTQIRPPSTPRKNKLSINSSTRPGWFVENKDPKIIHLNNWLTSHLIRTGQEQKSFPLSFLVWFILGVLSSILGLRFPHTHFVWNSLNFVDQISKKKSVNPLMP